MDKDMQDDRETDRQIGKDRLIDGQTPIPLAFFYPIVTYSFFFVPSEQARIICGTKGQEGQVKNHWGH